VIFWTGLNFVNFDSVGEKIGEDLSQTRRICRDVVYLLCSTSLVCDILRLDFKT
jgi:hypothetical protein